MRRLFIMLLPLSAWAGSYDYYECADAAGVVIESLEHCLPGQKQRRIEDNVRPFSQALEGRGARVIRLSSERNGQFFAGASVNGVAVRALVDTGASLVTVTPDVARRAGLDRLPFVTSAFQTANGASVVRIVSATVELGGESIRVPVAVIPRDLGRDFGALIGMAYLSHFEVNSAGGVMTLRRR